jgi:catechol 2,3-dioxygenase-like lactoylglutathione lyase family enzyme
VVGMTAADNLPRWGGVNHLALVTNDMDGTVRFYHGVLGMRLVATIRSGVMRHYFFSAGPGSTVAFFEWEGHDVGSIEKPAGIPPGYATQFDHVSFTLPDAQALEALQRRLAEHGVEVTTVVDHDPLVHSIYFHDNNGIALEASCWLTDPTSTEPGYEGRLFGDTNPVAAVHELASSGELAWTPSTALADDVVTDPV